MSPIVKMLVLAIAPAILAGCSKGNDAEGQASNTKADHAAKDIVRVVSQYDKVEVGRAAKATIEKANASHEADLREAGVETK